MIDMPNIARASSAGVVTNGQARVPAHVLVIGGAGFVGSVLVRRLLDHGYQVTVMDALMYGDEGMRDLYDRPGLVVVQGDVREEAAIAKATAHADAIVHLGGLVGDPACALDEQLTLEINLEATRTVAEMARERGIRRLIFASSCSLYGASEGVLDEQSPLDPLSVYARSKMKSEELLLASADTDFAPVVLRFGTFYGLSPRPRFDIVVNLLVAKAVTEGEISVHGGSQWRPFLHVDDGARAIMRCLEVPEERIRGQLFNVGSDEQNFTVGQIGETIAGLIPHARVVYQQAAADEANYRVSFAKIREALDFTPRNSLADGILEIKAALESGTVADYHDHRYSNHKSLTIGDGVAMLQRARSSNGHATTAASAARSSNGHKSGSAATRVEVHADRAAGTQ
jgi:nucleoside-diphosphate-sugar epimerase